MTLNNELKSALNTVISDPLHNFNYCTNNYTITRNGNALTISGKCINLNLVANLESLGYKVLIIVK